MYLDHAVLDGRPSVRTAEEWGLQWTNIGKYVGQSTKSTEGTAKHLCAQAWHKSNRNTQLQELMCALTRGAQYEPKVMYSKQRRDDPIKYDFDCIYQESNEQWH